LTYQKYIPKALGELNSKN